MSFVGLGAYRALAPLVSDHIETPITFEGRTRIALEREKSLVLRSIKELEFDHAMGKIAKSDFDEMSGRLRARAAGLIRQLDAGGDYREQISKEVEKRLEGGSSGGHHAAAASPACAQCGTAHDGDAKFCKNCGARL